MTNEIRYNSIGKEGIYSQQYSLRKGLKKIRYKGKVAAQSEVQQLYERKSFEPILVKDLSDSERKKAQESFMFFTEKMAKSKGTSGI